MSWNPNCRNVQRLLALWAGSDLVEAGQIEAQRHLASCPECREQWQRLKASHAILDEVRAAPVEAAEMAGSIWPALRRQMRATEVRPVTAAGWRGWLPAGALAAACLTVMVIGTAGPSPEFAGELSGQQRTVFSSQNVDSPVVHPSRFEQAPSRNLHEALPYRPRVHTLIDGTDVRDL